MVSEHGGGKSAEIPVLELLGDLLGSGRAPKLRRDLLGGERAGKRLVSLVESEGHEGRWHQERGRLQ